MLSVIVTHIFVGRPGCVSHTALGRPPLSHALSILQRNQLSCKQEQLQLVKRNTKNVKTPAHTYCGLCRRTAEEFKDRQTLDVRYVSLAWLKQYSALKGKL